MKNNLLSIDEYRNNADFYFSKGLRCANKKNLSEACKNLQKALELEPDNCEYRFNIACFFSEMKRLQEANRLFNDILINFDSTMYDCYFGLGCNSFEAGDAVKAAEYFEKYLFFDSTGEFSEEVSEMLFYLKLYDDISHNNGFIRRSDNSLKHARKYFAEGKLDKATKELYKSINANPANMVARNFLTLVLMLQQKYSRAEYLNTTVINFENDVWGNCLWIYILMHLGKKSKASKYLDILILLDVENREELLCLVTSLAVFNRLPELIILLETYIIEYNEPFIHSILLLCYYMKKDVEKYNETHYVLNTLCNINSETHEWINKIDINNQVNPLENDFLIDEYIKLFNIYNEVNDPLYNPLMYKELYKKVNTKRKGLGKRYIPIIDCALKHREIMYTRYYEREIIELLNDCLIETKLHFDASEYNSEAYAAALEYIYCKQYCIEIGKADLIKKYSINSILFDKALKKLKP